MAKIATVITDYFEDVEFTEPADAFKEAGHEVITIEKEEGKHVTGKQGEASVVINRSIHDAKPEEFDALFIPGGFSPDQLRGDETFVTFAKHFMDAEKPVLAICHGPQLLITAKSLEGREVTGFKSIQTDLAYAGATVKDQEVVVSKNQLVTSRQPDDIPAFIKESLHLLH
ncbi:type 1 glutamine amidotransferase domain-containing protein [Aquibacillus rhizosphaerae]|uniref:Type 1 glutamine amidotransferase domain-containing protein n=1 Tax=Aquibacillus rhizosphaerae TaxID=3051431 RepID=A0ABT7LBA0_9BACI|nr:type 1 glutamine amidotransferase domain-containing protein [Aquibacillus sp. LR5S19]MDL4843128.1 type 1 glutamine amidotransferase domain-containing protein [Aquibacillus sp. LR5S19]